jgi:hypothetical protein
LERQYDAEEIEIRVMLMHGSMGFMVEYIGS